ncbi:hypothetical protein SteCoe_35743 [Stentor coeruleus]|uniref:Uncharacterized protein n=1 Tax=Stentor coeruleus TaxID=5963 RepID=A0A1R2ARL6_9CILI|nr:hypothetical protein SteCoe_35743 [Stentor coeruleus]
MSLRPYSKKSVQRITKETEFIQQRYNYYSGRFNEIKKKTLSPTVFTRNSSSEFLQKKKELNDLTKKLEIVHKEKTRLTKSQPRLPKKSIGEMWLVKRRLEEQVSSAKELNQKLKANRKNLQKKTDEVITNEYNKTKKCLEELELDHKSKCIMISELKKTLGPEDDYKDLNNIGSTNQEAEYIKLQKYYKIIKKSYRANETKNKQKYKELQELEQKLQQDKVCLQMKILKTKQQERLLELSFTHNTDENTLIHNYTDPSFLYKPSVKGLYI